MAPYPYRVSLLAGASAASSKGHSRPLSGQQFWGEGTGIIRQNQDSLQSHAHFAAKKLLWFNVMFCRIPH